MKFVFFIFEFLIFGGELGGIILINEIFIFCFLGIFNLLLVLGVRLIFIEELLKILIILLFFVIIEIVISFVFCLVYFFVGNLRFLIIFR